MSQGRMPQVGLGRRKAQQLRVGLRGAGYEECGAVPDEDQPAPVLVHEHVKLHIGPAGCPPGRIVRETIPADQARTVQK